MNESSHSPLHAPLPDGPILDSILHPTDFSAGSLVAFHHALKAALIAKSKFTILHVATGASREWKDFPGVRQTLERWGVIPPGSPTGQGNQMPRNKCFSLTAEQSLLESAMSIVRPPKKPVNIKMIMRRAPTQEEFFRGSLSRNPISLSMLKSSGGSGSSVPAAPGEGSEPTVR